MLGANITLDAQLAAINLAAGSSLTIIGNNWSTIDGGGIYNGIFAYAGTG